MENVEIDFRITSDEDRLGADCFARAGAVLRRSEYSEKSFTIDFNYFNLYQEGADISSVPANVFENCTNLRSIDLPETIRYIGSKAFKDYYSRCTIAPDAFEGCPLME